MSGSSEDTLIRIVDGGASIVAQQAEAARDAAVQSAVTAASAALATDTLAQLQAVTNRALHTIATVNADGANNGTYRWNGSAWVRVSTATIPSLDARVSEAIKQEDVTGVEGGITDGSGRYAWLKITPSGGLWLNGLEIRYDANTDTVTMLGPDGTTVLASRRGGGVTIGDLSIWNDPARTDIGAAFADANGYLSFTLDPAGAAPTAGASAGFSAAEIATLDADGLGKSALVAQQYVAGIAAVTRQINLIILYGQSYSEGAYSHPALTTSSLDNLMLGNSVHPLLEVDDDFLVIGSNVFNPLVGNTVDAAGNVLSAAAAGALPSSDPARGETPGQGLATMLRRAFLAHFGLASDSSRRFVVGSCGVGGRSLASLEKGAAAGHYGRLTDYVTAAKAAADAASLTIGCAAFVFIGGESDEIGADGGYQNGATYKTQLKKLMDDFYADCVVGILGQTDRPAVYLNQLGATYARDAAGVALAQVQFCEEEAYAFNFGPYYHIPDVSNHLPGNGSRWLGNIAGKVVHKTLVRREEWKPLSPVRAVTRGRETLIQFHVPAPPLVFDLPYIGFTATNFALRGFAARDTAGVVPISAVEIVGSTVVKITHSRDVNAATLFITYAGEATFAGSGCLRDSDATVSADSYTFDGLSGQTAGENIAALVGRPYPQHNWCVRFDIAAPAG